MIVSKNTGKIYTNHIYIIHCNVSSNDGQTLTMLYILCGRYKGKQEKIGSTLKNVLSIYNIFSMTYKRISIKKILTKTEPTMLSNG